MYSTALKSGQVAFSLISYKIQLIILYMNWLELGNLLRVNLRRMQLFNLLMFR